jgi:hypothetical protein
MIDIFDFIGYFAAWCLICTVLNVIQMIIYSSLNFEKNLKIKLPKRKKFKEKETPIYEVFKTSDNEYAIRKWELDWSSDFYILNVFLFPILIEWFIWKYVERMEFFLCESIEMLDVYTEALFELIWEERYLEYKEEHDTWVSEHTQEFNNLNRLNTKFNKNYE